ncbi:hypothetical protein [Pseudoalteromonas sp. OOF1S-7]|uniref:hypothetical protein n=1 Tax=Pseudoalteromonas sp. OOF1S-7 TaxID=2917757 RepID=UPI001EF6D160|nr:hypothetical protein [Pseudoalteromonas sp. OOF1S-7]MCG7535630.1 hypothetical protein [Pseudoalteromonas sp. OOF1S-7]
MLAIFKSKPLLEDAQAQQLIVLFGWAVEHFDVDFFLRYTRIVEPTVQDFPDQVRSVEQMAQTVFDRVREYAGMQHWPISLLPPQQMPMQQTFPRFTLTGGLRGDSVSVAEEPALPVALSYNPSQINQPQDMVASLAGSLAMILIHQVGKLPPGGQEHLPVAADVLAVFMGFGVMLSNSAYHFRGGCGSCYNAYANRQAALSEAETVFVHALVCYFKPQYQGAKHLKPHLKSLYKKAQKQLRGIIKSSPDPVLLALEERSRVTLPG